MAPAKSQIDPGLRLQILAVIETIELVCKMLLALIPILKGMLGQLDAARKQLSSGSEH